MTGKTTAHSLRNSVMTTAGECPLPLTYRDCGNLNLIFLLDYVHAKSLLQDSLFEPAKLWRKVPLVISAFDNKNSNLGSYREIAMTVLAKPRGTRPSLCKFVRNINLESNMGFFPVKIALDHNLGCAVGREVWGFDKYKADVVVSISQDMAYLSILDELEIEVKPGLVLRTSTPHSAVLSSLRRELLRTTIAVKGRTGWFYPRTSHLQILGSGPISNRLRKIGLSGAKPHLGAITQDYSAVSSVPIPLPS